MGHYVRVRPTGLAESTARGSPAFVDAGLNRYFRSLRIVTGGERLLSANRIREIVRVNIGLYDGLLQGALDSTEGAESADAGLRLFLEQEFGSVPAYRKGTYAVPLHCRLLGDRRADVLLRRRIP